MTAYQRVTYQEQSVKRALYRTQLEKHLTFREWSQSVCRAAGMNRAGYLSSLLHSWIDALEREFGGAA